MSAVVRFARADEQEAVEEFARRFDAIKDFVFTWRRWDNWKSAPPIIAVDGAAVVGFHAATFGKRYCNSYYQAVAPEAQGQGLGGRMVDFLLGFARRRGIPRLKFKTPKDSPGQRFWEGFGARAIGEDDAHYLFDIDLRGVHDIGSFVEWLRRPALHAAPPIGELRRLARSGVRLYSKRASDG